MKRKAALTVFTISALSIAMKIITAQTMSILGAFVLQMLETTLTNIK